MGSAAMSVMVSRHRWPALVFGTAALACVLAAVALKVGGPAGILAGVGLVCLACGPLVLRLRSDRLDAPGLYGAISLATIGISSLAWLGQAPAPGPGLDQSTVANSLVLVATGLAGFTLGARMIAGPPLAAPRVRFAVSGPSWQVLTAAYVVCLGAILLGLAVGAYGYLATDAGTNRLGPVSGVLPFVAGQASVVILATAIAWLDRRDIALRRALLGMLSVQVPLGFVVGVKGESVIPLILIALAVVAAGHPLPWKSILGSTLVVLLLLVPANQSYRVAVRSEGGSSVLDSIRAVLAPASYRPDRTLPDAVNYVGTRFRNIDHVALIQRDTPSVYRYGDGSNYYLLPLIIAVPRPVWDGKPVLDTAGQFSRTYWEIPPSIRTSQPLTQAGDLYRNFGWGGVPLGLLLWGAAVGLWQRLRLAWGSPRFVLVYLWSLPTAVVYVESDLPTLIATFSKALLLVALVAWILLPGRVSPPGYRVIAGLIRRPRVRRQT